MSLVVWLPLDGDLRNLGCSNIEASSIESSPIYVDGKIGKCYQREDTETQSTKGIKLNNNFLNIFNTEASVAVWIKPLGAHMHYNGTILNSGNWNSKHWTFGISQDNSKVDVLCGGHNTYITCQIPLNEWTHLTSTYNNGVSKLYKNGVYIGELNNRAVFDSDATWTGIGKATYGNYFGFNGLINDLRIYDHCLSAAEVHEIAQGLVLHYKLDGGVTTAKNLIKNGYGELDSTNWGSSAYFSSEVPLGHPEIKKSIYSNTTIEYIPIKNTHSYKLEAYLKNTATSGNTYPSLYPYDIDKNFIYYYNCPEGFNLSTMTFLTQELKSGDTKIYVNDLSKWNANSGTYYNYAAIFNYSDSTGYVYPNGAYTRDTPAFGSSNTAKTNLDKTNNIITLNSAYSGPTKSVGTAICAATAGSTYYYPFGSLTKSSLNDWTYKTATMIPNNIPRLKYAKYLRYSTYDGTLHAGIKLIDLADDIDSTIISDSSGYGHNGETINEITISSDTPRYDSGTQFNGSNTAIKVPDNKWMVQGTEAITINLWAKSSAWTGVHLFSCTESGGFNTEAGNSGYLRFPVHVYTNAEKTSVAYKYDSKEIEIASLSTTDWNMLTFVYDSTGTRTYINGELHHTYTNTSYGIHFNTGARLFLGCEASGASPSSPYFNGQISDFRIYYTPLLDKDIKLLYNTSMRVDNFQGIHSFEFDESGSRELLQGINITSSYSTHSSTNNPYTKYQNGELYFNTNSSSASSDYIPISPSGKTYYYDFDISVNAGNQFYIGFERYDANKTSRSNNACTYIYATKSTEDINHKHIFGTVNLSTDGVNPCAFMTLRILNGWSGTTSGVTGIATIHRMSLREVTTLQKPQIGKNGITTIDELKEYQTASIYKNGLFEANNFIEN